MTRARPGLGLIEVIVAITILSFGLLGLTAATAVAHNALTTAAAMEHGTRAAAAVIDSLMCEPAPTAGSRRTGPVRVTWSVHDDAGTIRIDLDVVTPGRPEVPLLTFSAVHHAR